jgi:hypothetical protein
MILSSGQHKLREKSVALLNPFGNTRFTRREAGLMMLFAAILVACEPAIDPRPQVTAIGGRIDLGVASLDVITEYTSSGQEPYIDHIIRPSPATELSQWAKKTLHPADQEGNVLFTIMNAAMTEVEIEGEDGLKALFTNQQRLLVNVKLEGVLSFSHPDGRKSATVVLMASAEKSIADNTSPAEADEIRLKTISEAIGRFDREFRTQLRALNGAWPLYSN